MGSLENNSYKKTYKSMAKPSAVTNTINNKYDKGFIAFKIHFLGNDSSREKASAWIKNVWIIDVNPGKYALKMDIPAREIT